MFWSTIIYPKYFCIVRLSIKAYGFEYCQAAGADDDVASGQQQQGVHGGQGSGGVTTRGPAMQGSQNGYGGQGGQGPQGGQGYSEDPAEKHCNIKNNMQDCDADSTCEWEQQGLPHRAPLLSFLLLFFSF